MTEELENRLDGICPSCKEETTLEYLGPQESIKGPHLQLYNCSSCKSTIDRNSFYDLNNKPKESSQ